MNDAYKHASEVISDFLRADFPEMLGTAVTQGVFLIDLGVLDPMATMDLVDFAR